VEAEAERCAPLPASCSLLGVPSAAWNRAINRPLTPRQGSSPWVQGKAGICYLPCQSAPWRQEEARAQGESPLQFIFGPAMRHSG
jgi:hypothetical protein